MKLRLLPFFFVLIACANPRPSAAENRRLEPAPPASSNDGGLAAYLASVPCPGPDVACAEVDVAFDPGNYSWTGSPGGQTILVVDVGLAPFAAMKYRKRVKSLLRVNALGEVEANPATVRMPRYLDTFFAKLSAQDFTPVENLVSLSEAEPIQTLLSRFSDLYSPGHGSIPLQFLAEHNPSAAFVLLQEPSFPDLFRSDFCARNFAEFHAKIQHAASTLASQAIAVYDVKYINFSAGITPTSLRGDWHRLCNGSLTASDAQRLVDAFTPYYKVLFSTPGVLGVQAGTDSSIGKTSLDCDEESYPNRVRAGYFLALDSRLSPTGERTGEGGDLEASIPSGQRQVESCLDVLVNFGVKDVRPFPLNATPFMLFDIFGLSSYPINFGHTSWAAPLALSRLIDIANKNFGGRLETDDDIQRAKAILVPAACAAWRGDGLCKYQDPLLNRQLELYQSASRGGPAS